MSNEKSEEIKNILCENAEQNLEKYKDFHFGEFVEKPNQCGYFERNGNWYTYVVDEKNFCTFTGPFSKNGVIYACSKILHISKRFKEYKFTEHELEIYINNNFHSFDEIDKMQIQTRHYKKLRDTFQVRRGLYLLLQKLRANIMDVLKKSSRKVMDIDSYI